MPILLLIRHGENDYVKTHRLAGRGPGVHLNDKGRVQAAALAEALKHVPLAAVYSSPLDRALETAEPIASARALPIRSLPALMDGDVGQWQGEDLRRLSRLPEWKTVQRSPSRFRFPGGESFMEQQSRLVTGIELLTREHEPTSILALVFHADPIRLVLAFFLGMPLDYFQRLGCAPGSVSIVAVNETGAFLHGLNLLPPFTMPSAPRRRGRRRKSA